MAAGTPKPKSKTTVNKLSQQDDPNAVHEIFGEKNLDPAYDEMLGDDIAFDYKGKSGDPGDRAAKKRDNLISINHEK